METFDDLVEETSSGFVIRERCRCGKARYRSEAQAGRAAKNLRLQKRDRRREGLLRPYFCRVSRSWHVGHTDE